MTLLTCEDGRGVVPRVVRAESLAAELVLGPEEVVASLIAFALVLLLDLVVPACGRVGPTLGVETVGAAHQQVGGVRLGQHANVILALVLEERLDNANLTILFIYSRQSSYFKSVG